MYNGFVYLAKSDTGQYKIGRSKNPYGRIKHFDTSMPVGVELIHYIPCDDPVHMEGALHKRYKEHRTSGEWFNLPKDVLDFLCKVTHSLNRLMYVIVDDDLVSKVHHPYVSVCCQEYARIVVERIANELIESVAA